VDDAERSEREAAGFARGGKRRVDAAEVRKGYATTRAVSTEVTLLATIVILSEHRQTRVRDQPLAAELREENLACLLLRGVERPRRLKLTIRQMGKILATSLYPDESLDMTPPWSEILVSQRPIDSKTLPRIRLEVDRSIGRRTGPT